MILKRIIESLSQVSVSPTDEGLIPAFNVFVNQFPATLWNSYAERLTRRVGPDLLPVAEYLLVNAAHECGYHTGYGIITSEEWTAVVGPMIEKAPEDILAGAFERALSDRPVLVAINNASKPKSRYKLRYR